MREHIILTKEQADTVKGTYGKHSVIRPIALPDGTFIIPEKCLSDSDLKDAKSVIESCILPAKENVQDIIDLPKIGEEVRKGKVYVYENLLVEGSQTLVIAQQDHMRTEHDPKDIPALFTFFRENADDLLWIPNEKVDLGWIRIHNGKTYEVIQAHMTVEGQTPDIIPALWKEILSGITVWKQPTGGHDAYKKGDKVYFPTEKDSVYESLIDANVWSPTVYPAGWKKV